MFKNAKYITRGVNAEIPLAIQLICWSLIKKLGKKQKLDYLQVFVLSDENGRQVIEHKQEQPKYSRKYVLKACDGTINTKLFAIDDEDHSTLMLADEY